VQLGGTLVNQVFQLLVGLFQVGLGFVTCQPVTVLAADGVELQRQQTQVTFPGILDEVVGYAATADGLRAFVWDEADGMSLLDVGQGYAFGISGSGRYVAGSSRTETGAEHAYVYDRMIGTLVDLGTVGGSWSVALGVNDDGVAVGSSADEAGVERPFIAVDGTVTRLGTLSDGPGRAVAVNDAGVIVGWSENGQGEVCAVVWDADGEAVDLNGLVESGAGWHLREATGVDAQGRISGTAVVDGQPRAFLLDVVR